MQLKMYAAKSTEILVCAQIHPVSIVFGSFSKRFFKLKNKIMGNLKAGKGNKRNVESKA